MREKSATREANPEDIEYIEKMCYEFARLLYDISEENDRIYKELEEKYTRLESQCSEYEAVIFQSGPKRGIWKLRLRIKARKAAQQMKTSAGAQLLMKIAARLFGFGRRLVTRLGLKERMKSSKTFKRLYQRGIIDKLRGGVPL